MVVDSTALGSLIDANKQAIKDTASQIRSDIPDVSGFATIAELYADSTVLQNQINVNSNSNISALSTKENSDSTALGALIDDNTSNIATNTTGIATNLATIGNIQTKMVADSNNSSRVHSSTLRHRQLKIQLHKYVQAFPM